MDYHVMRVSEVCSKEVLKVNKSTTLSEALRLFLREGTDRALVYESDTPVGIVTVKDLVKGVGIARTKRVPTTKLHVSSVMSSPLITVEPEVTLPKAARVMLERSISSLPVRSRESDVFEGMLSKWDLAKVLVNVEESVAEVMTTSVITVKETSSILSARRLMVDEGLSLLPVMNVESKVVGIITLEDIARTLIEFIDVLAEEGAKDSLRRIRVGDILRPLVPEVPEGSSIGKAAKVMLDRRVRGVLILGEEHKEVKGIVTLTDLTRYLVRH